MAGVVPETPLYLSYRKKHRITWEIKKCGESQEGRIP